MVTRKKTEFKVNDLPNLKAKLFAWAANKSPVAWYDTNAYPHQKRTYDAILAVQSYKKVCTKKELKSTVGFDWLFGFFSYEFSTSWEHVNPSNPAYTSVQELQFFCPEKVWLLEGDVLTAHYLSDDDAKDDFDEILATTPLDNNENTSIDLTPRISKSEYIEKAKALQKHIMRGDIYEVNYCMEWFAKNVSVYSPQLFNSLNARAQTPFAAYLHIENTHLMCASPERFLKREGNTITSQPIKGTAARHQDVVLDAAAAQHLKSDPKERSENIMITDLVRNDLSRIAKRGSVKVVEQCVVYPFALVHQMISTITATCDPSKNSLDIIEACFPMGSMTGAPKQRAMELIDKYEVTKRGLYSGAVGYISPNGDFDFNVVIRSIAYDAAKGYVSFHVGSALTATADPEKEYEECLLKAKALMQVLGADPRAF